MSAPAAMRNRPCPCGSGLRYKSCHGALSTDSRHPPSAIAGEKPIPDLGKALQLHESGRISEAIEVYESLLAIKPDNPVPMHFLGVAAMQRGDVGAAIPLLERAAKLAPSESNFHGNLGLALVEAGRIEDALTSYSRALEVDPRNHAVWSNLGLARQALLDVDGAILAFREAIRLFPDFDRAHWNLAYALLLAGKYDEGWKEYEWRLRIGELAGGLPAVPGPVWDGQIRPGLRVHVHAEQGLGDTIQFARFIAPLVERGLEISFECPAPLLELFSSLSGHPTLIATGEKRPDYDAHVALPSLPKLLGVSTENLASFRPYLASKQEAAQRWRTCLSEMKPSLNVGIAWGGNPQNPYDRHRSCALATWEPLARIPGVRLVSLQTGAPRDQLSDLAETSRPLDWAQSLAETAAQMEALDLVISVDTSIAHLAGALGRPVWVLLPYSPDWRWLTRRPDSIWYPSARLFRQERRGDWSSPIEQVARMLRRGVAP